MRVCAVGERARALASLPSSSSRVRSPLTADGKKKWKLAPPKVRVFLNPDPKPLEWIEKWKSPTTGKWVHNYTLAARQAQQRSKFEENREFGKMLPKIRARYRADLASDDKETRVIALIVALIDQAYFRIGNEGSDQHGVHGITTLRRKHVGFEGASTVRFDYVGKKKVEQHKIVCDAKLARMVRVLHGSCSRPSQRLFRADDYEIGAADVNGYLAQFGVTAKQFRTYHATRIARELLRKAGRVDEVDRERVIKAVIEAVAERIGHEPATCRDHYIDPVILRAFRKGKLR